MATYLYVSLQGDDVIARYDLDPATGGLTNRVEYPLAGMPAPMATDPEKRFPIRGSAPARGIRDDVLQHRWQQRLPRAG